MGDRVIPASDHLILVIVSPQASLIAFGRRISWAPARPPAPFKRSIVRRTGSGRQSGGMGPVERLSRPSTSPKYHLRSCVPRGARAVALESRIIRHIVVFFKLRIEMRELRSGPDRTIAERCRDGLLDGRGGRAGELAGIRVRFEGSDLNNLAGIVLALPEIPPYATRGHYLALLPPQPLSMQVTRYARAPHI